MSLNKKINAVNPNALNCLAQQGSCATLQKAKLNIETQSTVTTKAAFMSRIQDGIDGESLRPQTERHKVSKQSGLRNIYKKKLSSLWNRSNKKGDFVVAPTTTDPCLN